MECRQPLETGRGKETHSLLEPLEGVLLARTLTLGFLTSGASNEALKSVVIFYSSNRKLRPHNLHPPPGDPVWYPYLLQGDLAGVSGHDQLTSEMENGCLGGSVV